jgi:hypothetical protein
MFPAGLKRREKELKTMAETTKRVKELFDKVPIEVLTTATPDGTPKVR